MNSTRLCECGCSAPAPIDRSGRPQHFVNGHQNRKPVLYDVVDCGYETPCWVIRGRRENTGYAAITRNGRKELAHRVSYREHYGEIPKGKEVCHHCDIRACWRPDHLFAGTRADNVHDMIQKGREYKGPHPWSKKPNYAVRGERHPKAVADRTMVLAIFREYEAGGISERRLAARYGVSRGVVRRIVTGTAWGWLTKLAPNRTDTEYELAEANP